VCCLCLCNLHSSALELTLQNFVNLCNQRPPEGIRMHKIRFAPGLCPRPHWGSSRRSPRLPSWMGRGIPLPIPLPPRRLGLGTFGVSVSAPIVSLPPNFFFVPTYLGYILPESWNLLCRATDKHTNRVKQYTKLKKTHRSILPPGLCGDDLLDTIYVIGIC